MNKAILQGNVGKDPEIKMVGDKKVARFSLATQSYRKDSEGNKVTDWHNIVCWEKLADLTEKYIKKGSSLIVEGEIQYREYNNAEGVKKYITEIKAGSLHLTGKKEESNDLPVAKQQWAKSKEQIISEREDISSTDLPF